MKILLANKFFYLNGGSERVFFQERNFLIEEGYPVIDFSMQDDRNFPSKYSSFFAPNINYHQRTGIFTKVKHAVSFIHSQTAVNNIKILVEKERPKIAHLHNIYHQLTPSIIQVLKENDVKVIMTIHDFKLICPNYLALNKGTICTACGGSKFIELLKQNCQNSWHDSLLLSLEAYWHKWRKSYDGVDLFIAPSRFIAELVARRVQPSKITILHNGIDTDNYQPNYGNCDGYALYYGRLSKEKGIETLLKAYERIQPKLSLKVVGTGPIENNLKAKYPAAEFLGYKTGQKLKELISRAAFVVVPSEWYENCSMVVLEAMASGKPVIGSNVGGIPEQIEDCQSGFLFEMGNTRELASNMLTLHNDPELLISMGKAARKKVQEEYSLITHCNQLLKIYNSTLSH